MAMITRRRAITAGAILGGAGVLRFLDGQGKPPTAAWVRERLWGDNLLAYAIWDGVPRAVLRFGNRVQYDLMIPGDWLWPNWPPAPQWQFMGLGYSIARSDAPATAGFAPCVGVFGERCGRSIELFGQINDPGIVGMEVLGDGDWRSFPVAAPGYAIRVEGHTGAPAGIRWLTAEGRIVQGLDDVTPTKPASSETGRGERDTRRRRGRRASPPASTPGAGGNDR